MKKSITQLADIIRSKNSGPYELTMDLMFNRAEDYHFVKANRLINEELICGLYRIPREKIIGIVYFDPAKAVKVTIVRPICSGDLGEKDVYGAQQHAPLLSIHLNMPEEA